MHLVAAAVSSTLRALDDNETLSRSFHAIMIACRARSRTMDGSARVINRSMREKTNRPGAFYVFNSALRCLRLHLHPRARFEPVELPSAAVLFNPRARACARILRGFAWNFQPLEQLSRSSATKNCRKRLDKCIVRGLDVAVSNREASSV
jgi:hypothetical protein